MQATVFEEYKRLLDLEPEILNELIQELDIYLNGGPMQGYVYLMRYDTGYYKVGFAKKPPTRQYSLEYDEKDMEVRVEVIHIIETDDMKRFEKDVAKVFNQSSEYIGKEMWDLSEADKIQFCSISTVFYGDKGSRNIQIF